MILEENVFLSMLEPIVDFVFDESSMSPKISISQPQPIGRNVENVIGFYIKDIFLIRFNNLSESLYFV